VNLTDFADLLVTAILRDRLLPVSLGTEYRYAHLPLCVIDSVYSLNSKYKAVQNTVERFCSDRRQFRPDFDQFPSVSEQMSMSAFCQILESNSSDFNARQLFRNRQRTSTRNGILKAEAVLKFALVLRLEGVEYFQDVPLGSSELDIAKQSSIEHQVKQIAGQRSGLSLEYFWMLAGMSTLIKPDRHILNYVAAVVDHFPSGEEAISILCLAAKKLAQTGHQVTPRELDYGIWQYQRNRS
jgi:hypothetical protein